MKKLLHPGITLMGLILFIFMSANSQAQNIPWWENWVKYDNNPVMTGIPGTWCNSVLFPVVIQDEGIFKMWFTGWGDARQIGYATSPYGIDWTIHPDPVIAGGGISAWDRHKLPYTVLRIDDTLHMWYDGFPSNYSTVAVGYAWSLNGEDWTIHPVPVLEKGTPGSWDDSGVGSPAVYFDGIKYHMWYNDSDIGYATSDDGINWEKDTINSPVITKGPPGGWCDELIYSGGLIMHNDTIHMLFSGFDGTLSNPPGYFRTGYAWSADFINWTLENDGEAVFDIGAPGDWDSHGAAAGSVLFHDGKFKMWYSGQSSIFAIGYAAENNLGIGGADIGAESMFTIFPNPCSGTAYLRYTNSELRTLNSELRTLNSELRTLNFELYSIQGIKVKTLLDDVQQPGDYELSFDVSDLPAGMYFLRMQSGESLLVGKLVVIH